MQTGDKPLWQWSATALAEGIRTGQICSVEAVSSCVNRMETVNPDLNAVVIDLSKQALRQAELADDAVTKGDILGPLHGVPITIKVNVDVKDQPNSNGIVALSDYIAPEDAPVVRNIKKAGAIIIGMTNTPDFSLRMMTDNQLYGLTKNPWNPAYTCGGSSGGAASALAAGICPIAHGNDIGGSLRIPAFCCGIASIRPTIGRVPAYNPSQREERGLSAQLFSVQGPMAREVRDVRLLLEVMAGGDLQDPWWVPAPMRGPEIQEPIRVAVARTPGGEEPHTAISQAIEKAAGYLEDAGYTVEEVEPPFSRKLGELWITLMLTEIRQLLGDTMDSMGSRGLKTFLASLFRISSPLDLEGYMRALMQRTTHIRQWQMFLKNYPLVLSPLSLVPHYRVDEDLEGDARVTDMLSELLPSFSMNVLGLPAAVVPIGLHENVPHGIQIVGQRFREDLVLDAAQAIENRTGLLSETLWQSKLP